jgi:hypothetical protein
VAAPAGFPETSFLLRLEKCDVAVSKGDTRILALVNVAVSPFFAWAGGQVALEWIGPPTDASAHLIRETSIRSMTQWEAKFDWSEVQFLSDCVDWPFWCRGIWPKANVHGGTRKIKGRTKVGQLQDELPEVVRCGFGEIAGENCEIERVCHPPFRNRTAWAPEGV